MEKGGTYRQTAGTKNWGEDHYHSVNDLFHLTKMHKVSLYFCHQFWIVNALQISAIIRYAYMHIHSNDTNIINDRSVERQVDCLLHLLQ